MKTPKLLTTLAIASLFLVSCEKEEKDAGLFNPYLPLEAGNFWQFDDSGKINVNGVKIINSKNYYLVQQNTDSFYYRIEKNKVYVIVPGAEECVKFNLSAKVNDSWNFNSYTVKLKSKTDTITINDHKIYNCYNFYFDIPAVNDVGHTIWLAPGIGFIQNYCGFCFNKVQKLNKAKINGTYMVF